MNKKLFEQICNAPGVPGFEDEVQDIAMDIFKGCCDEVHRDAMGSVIGLRKATIAPKGKQQRPFRLMLAAHADEIGLMVKHISSNGMIHFIQVGGINPQVVQSQRMIIHGKKKIRGVVVPRGGTIEKPVKLEDLLIDTGMPKDELEKWVTPGDVVSFEDDVSILNGKMWVGRNFDNRMGSYCLLEAMRTVGDTAVDVYAVSTVQEEVGLRGAGPSAFACEPDVALAIDGSMARGAYVADHENLCEPGEGTGIYLIDNLTIGHPRLVRYLLELCAKHKIPCQRNIGGGTDAKAIQQSRRGVVATTIGAPVRYMHSTVQLCHADDIDATVALLVKFMEHAHTFMGSLKD
ncbi:MAG TPA: endoglucanase [Verrucomicrobia bacterium]|nr:endoglucanase [Verrucomicrobiota bacterium]